MAKKDTVYIDIHTSDGGTMKKVAVSAKKLGIALKDVEAANKKTGQGAKNADRNLKGLSKQSANSTKNFSKMAQGMTGTLVPAYAVLAANVFAITAAFAFLKKAGDFRVMQESQLAFTGATGVGMKTLTTNIQEASGAMLDFEAASESASIGIASGLGAGQIEELAAGAGNLSKILGRDVTDSFHRLIRGVTKAEPELLDELGITLRLADAQENYAATLGKSAKDLTIYEKKQAVFVEVQGQLEQKYNAVAKATNVQANAVAKLGVAFDKIMKVVKKYTALIAEPVAEFFTKNIGSMTAALALLAIPILRSIIPGLDEWAAKSKEASAAASASYKKAGESLKKYQKQQADIRSGKSIADTIDKPSEGLRKGFGKGQDKMSKASAAQLLRNAVSTNKKLAHLDKKQLAAYRIHLKAQVRGSMHAYEKIYLYYLEMGNKMNVVNKQIVARWRMAMAAMTKVAAGFTRVMGFLMRAMGWVGIALMLKDVGMELLKFLGYFKDDKDVIALQEEIGTLTDKTKEVNKEFQNFTAIQREMRNLAADEGKPRDHLHVLEVEGAMTESIGSAILKNIKIRSKEGELLEKIKAKHMALNVEQTKELDILNKGVLNSKVPQWRPAPAGHPNKEALEKLKRAYGDTDEGAAAAAARMVELRLKVIRFNQAGNAATDAADELKETMDGLSSETKLAADTMLEYINSLPSGQITGLQEEYRDLLKTIKASGELSGDALIRFQELTEQIGEMGLRSKATNQAINSLNTQYQTMVAGLTTYKTAHSDMIDQYEKEYDAIVKIVGETGKLDSTNVIKLNDILVKLDHLNKLRKQEIGFKLQSLKIDISLTKQQIGRTTLEKASIKRSHDILKNNNKINELTFLLNQAKTAAGVIDDKKIEDLTLQRDLLYEQNIAIERQGDMMAQMFDSGRQAFETSMSGAISKFLKGEETSITDLFLGIGKSVVDAMIDSFSKSLTEKIMGFIPGYKTADQKTEAAILKGHTDGSAKVKEEIIAGIEAATPIFTKALDAAANRFAQAIRDACASCTCAEEGAKAGIERALPVAQTIMPKNGYADIDTYDTMYAADMARQNAEWVPSWKDPNNPNYDGPAVDAGAGTSNVIHAEDRFAGDLSFSEGHASGVSIGGGLTSRGWWNEPGTGGLGADGGIQKVLNVDESGFPVGPAAASSFDSNMPDEGMGSIAKDALNPNYMDAAQDGKEDPKKENTEALKKNSAMTLKTAMGLGMAVTALAGNSKAGQALQKIMAAVYLFDQVRSLWDKFNAAKETIEGGANTGAVLANTVAVAANTAVQAIPGRTGIYPPLGYAAGGVARGPRAGYPAILHGNEAVVPLPNGRDIPVTFPKGVGGSGTQNNNVGITVNIDNQGQTSTDMESDDQEAGLLGERLAFVVQEELINQKRAGGLLSPYGVA